MAGAMKTVAFLLVAFAAVAFAEDYTVGDDQGWGVPANPNFYPNWAAGKTFRVGDVLEFDFSTGAHDVTVVTKEAHDSCNKANPTTQITNGPANIRLNTTGPHYFICTVGPHCSLGQKLSINVVGGGAPGGPTSSPPTTPSGTTTAPPPPNAASSLGAPVVFLAAMGSLALAFLL